MQKVKANIKIRLFTSFYKTRLDVYLKKKKQNCWNLYFPVQS